MRVALSNKAPEKELSYLPSEDAGVSSMQNKSDYVDPNTQRASLTAEDARN